MPPLPTICDMRSGAACSPVDIVSDIAIFVLKRDVKLQLINSPVDIMMIVWRTRGKIIRTVLCCVVYDSMHM